VTEPSLALPGPPTRAACPRPGHLRHQEGHRAARPARRYRPRGQPRRAGDPLWPEADSAKRRASLRSTLPVTAVGTGFGLTISRAGVALQLTAVRGRRAPIRDADRAASASGHQCPGTGTRHGKRRRVIPAPTLLGSRRHQPCQREDWQDWSGVGLPRIRNRFRRRLPATSRLTVSPMSRYESASSPGRRLARATRPPSTASRFARRPSGNVPGTIRA
jgi:hypothetical protein